jgi:hypothetical protein
LVSKYARRTDSNQALLAEAARAAGWTVRFSFRSPDCLLDFVASKRVNHLRRVTVFVECKNPGELLTDSEKQFFQTWAGHSLVARDAEELTKFLADVERLY